ncbi:hypothetical protein FNV43_RR11980 [Rhamnella rubrinervis]|uniref:Uncharacterized protein n=1 Tax=Rhamnella rubrinervis TaxID=2594499 RepID=A0A8K0H6U0_9ROSA|nr:hypothetical protein FNV43_RR11980 [Rhamnella rubrinervis]
MESVAVDQSISAYKQIRTPKKINRAFSSVAWENLTTTNIRGGLLNAPPPSLSFSYPPSASFVAHHQYLQIQQQQQQKQPPLLPLPIPGPHHQSPPPPRRNRGLSCPPKRDHPTTPKKSKSKPSSVPKLELQSRSTSQDSIVASTNPSGPEPNDLPKDVSKVLWSSSSGKKSITSVVSVEDLEKFSGSVFSLAPPPSSLPLPRFSLRPKLSCNAEATGIDAGATDNLCRLLRLR